MYFEDSDGAAALVLVSGEKALELGLPVIAKIRGYADAAQVWSYEETKSLFSQLGNIINQVFAWIGGSGCFTQGLCFFF